MTGRLLVGCPMWANRAWVGPYYPSTTRPGDELAQYVHWCNAVEGNTTFYALPGIDTVRKWADTTPADFRFVFKVPRSITHDQRLRGTDAELTAFVRLLEPLGERCAPLSIQLPPTFGPGDLGVLASFLRRAPRSVAWAVEVRHADFFTSGPARDRLDRLLADSGVERVMLDSRQLFSAPPTDDAERAAWTSKPRLPVVIAEVVRTPIVRIIGRTREDETVAGWAPWFPLVAGWIEAGCEPIVLIHTPDNATVPHLARKFHAAAAAVGCAVGVLPRAPEHSVAQGSLFD